ncbi:Sarcosine oxidase, gamma subunit [Polymorphum gilvum SL003B-26A1]|uniref:Sarcosine oxidase, gamma subunit n=1 Tax=Polymorphum gilvum (strain LMG 25793 / CGMCC 1.9160 / SL003B-26A1) TaxID=991905 RepID=F2IWQ0_POLGS|nr:Sarcosine oxidase, gamma subunit [Polymorphum gilvum SL003B-26A1]
MPIDLDPAAFPPGTATRTLFHKAEIVLWRTDEDVFVLEAWRTFLPYVEGLLADAALELSAR